MKSMKFCPYCGKGLIDNVIDDKARKACASGDCGFIHWNNPIPVVAAVVEYRGDVLLARNAAWPEKMFGLVTGFLEQGEHPEAGIIREVKEELGLCAEISDFLGHYPFPQQNQLIIAFGAKADGDIVLSEEIAEIIRVNPQKVRPWDFGTGLALKEWQARHATQKG